MQQRDHAEAFRHYEWLVKELPTHPVASWGYYWQAVRALADGNQALAKEKAAALRRCFAGRPDFLWQWELDCFAMLMLFGDVDEAVYPKEFVLQAEKRLAQHQIELLSK
jgi:hypothetical protein